MSFSNGLSLLVGDAAEPEVFTKIPKMNDMGGLGKTNSTIDVTNWDSEAKEYISGMADGSEITLSMNYLIDNAVQKGLIDDVDSKSNRNFRFEITDKIKTQPFTFTLALTTWGIAPSGEDKHVLNISGKISGEIVRGAVTTNA